MRRSFYFLSVRGLPQVIVIKQGFMFQNLNWPLNKEIIIHLVGHNPPQLNLMVVETWVRKDEMKLNI